MLAGPLSFTLNRHHVRADFCGHACLDSWEPPTQPIDAKRLHPAPVGKKVCKIKCELWTHAPQQKNGYSITSSASNCIEFDTESPIA
jgi:hypothetical protein